ncbi:GNAT family N-acetyltransferase [Sediminibacillus halophilus]|uniref:Acetyltransferase (GNAT) domain-containing protein n=1 Tax=Sediminibacillus halophilus TaxID=482461 RepID=A0A1G9M8H8_9BACI|nr:GNAT family N-acetyltransferase [Sediminibacillus halophilus]SDL69975.1 Acetyltransferase (GNAT) domain-containing protein [Sediminibacillus halophilus]
MEIKNGEHTVFCRTYESDDFDQIQNMNEREGWNNLVVNWETTKRAWEQSQIAYVLEDRGKVVGYIRGLTDSAITLYICELLIAKQYRGLGLGKKLLAYVYHLYPETRMEMLATSGSKEFYEKNGFRPFYGFRKMIKE